MMSSTTDPKPKAQGPRPALSRPFLLERVDDAAVVQLYADGFEALSLQEKVLAWHLYEAAIAGRDIYYDQRYRHGLAMRELIEQVLTHGEKVEPTTLSEIRRYAKLFWINSGPFNAISARKFVLRLDREALRAAVHAAAQAGARLPLDDGESIDALIERLAPAFLDPGFDPVVTSKSPTDGRDMLEASASNLYDGVRIADLEGFDERHALNSRLVKRYGQLVEQVYRAGGMYGEHIRRVIAHLRQAERHAPPSMAEALQALIRFYETGEEADRRAYDIAWVADQSSTIDTINGFVEVYMDPRGHKGSWQGLVCYVNREKTHALEAIAGHAQWFEDHMPYDPAYRRPDVRGVTARAIDVIVETGDAGPLTAIGINLPNDQAVREQYGSKSVSLANVVEAYDKSTPTSFRVEFSWSPEEAERAERWQSFANELTTALHEILGHGSGRVSPRLNGMPQAFLKEQYSALEETRADLVALYFIADPKLVEIGVVTDADHETVVRAEYEGYARNALVQLRRVREGTQLEEDHMRNRQAIVHWLMANAGGVERRSRDAKTYYVVTDWRLFREGVGRMLGEVQRIKSEGDYEAAGRLVEAHGVHFDPALRDEVVARVDALDLPSYTGFVMPRLVPEYDDSGAIVDVRVEYPLDLEAQMLAYAGKP